MANPQLGDSQKQSYAYALNDKVSDFVALKAGQTVTVTSDSASVIVAPDASPTIHLPGDPTDGQPDPNSNATGFLVGSKTLGTANITFSALDADGTTKLVADVVDSIDVVVGAAVTAAVTLGTPIDQ